jgi:hypothetical protein
MRMLESVEAAQLCIPADGDGCAVVRAGYSRLDYQCGRQLRVYKLPDYTMLKRRLQLALPHLPAAAVLSACRCDSA